ncbi:MAG: helicase-exonuclease AddAB subunit AddA [Ruminococcus sp.]|nr:helicase-exonuclease AddAB subunit AddA [Ruminococcus sp.]
MATWTNEQLDAINGDGCSIMVSAAAGSGKTSVLVERLVRILSDRTYNVSADRMIVVTFTKDSASEMKQRLIKAITLKMEQEPNNDWLTKQHSMLQNAKISTIHSFCFDLIRDNINSLNLSPNFKIVEPTEEKILCLQATQDAIESMYKENQEEMLFLSQSICDKTDDGLEKVLIDLYDFLISVPFFEDWFQEKCIDYYSKADIYNDVALDSIFNSQIEVLKQILSLSDRSIELCEQSEDEKALNILQSENDFFSQCIELLQSKDRFNVDILKSLNSYKFVTLRFSKDNIYSENIKKYRNSYKELLQKNSKINFSILIDVIENYSQDKATNRRVSAILLDLIKSIHKNLSALKSEENVLGFSDAEQIAIQLLAIKDDDGNIIKSELAENLSEYYQIIMIDEFQDSNNNQDLIFKMLSKDGTSEKMGRNMFVVGDVKQSIYNFRLANPQNFINVMEYSKPYNRKNPNRNSYIKLNRNFRSSKDVIDFVNYIFENIMTDKVGEVVYDGGERLIYGANYPQGDRCTEIPLIDTNRFSEAEYIANTIKSMVDNEYPVVERDGSIRKCRLSDFCMLFMSTTDIDMYFEKLQELGLSVNFDQDEEYLKSREVSLLINMLKIVNNPMDNMALTSIMMSPLFMFTPDDVAIIRLVNRNASMYSSMVEISKDINYSRYSKELVSKIDYMIDTLNRLRDLSANCTTAQLMSSIVEATDLISIMQVYDTSEKRRRNVQILLKLAQNHDDNSTTGISGFIRYINNILESNEDINVKNSVVSSDSINMKTIHKSKGLEFPFVFLCNVDKNFNEKDISGIIQKNFNHGLSYKLKDRNSLVEYTTVDRICMCNEKRLENRSEKMRLMYVALTRAKERLFIPLSFDKSSKKILNRISNYIDDIQYEGKITTTLTKNATSMCDWLLMVLCCSSKSQPLREFFGLPIEKNYVLNCYPNVNIYEYNPNVDDSTSEDVSTNEEVVTFNVNQTLKQEILTRCNFKYINDNADLPARISVSDIVKSDSFKLKGSPSTEDVVKNSIEDLRTPNFMSSNNLTPAEKGTAIHIVMQYCNFENLRKSPTVEINRLLDEGYLTKEQFNVIDVSMFNKLILSDIFNLITNNAIAREREFLVRVSDLDFQNENISLYKNTETMLQGCVDMIVFQDDGATIIDYKTDNVLSMEVLKQRYSLQIELYKYAIQLVEHVKVKRCLIYSMKLGKSIEM